MATDAMLAMVAEQSKLPKVMFVIYLCMGMSKIHWREEGDPIINRIKDKDMIYPFGGKPPKAGEPLFWTNQQ